MQKQITIEQLAGYLPYGLPIKILNSYCDYVNISESKVNGFYYLGDHLHVTYEGGGTGKSCSEFKPYLRPLSSLTKEITHNGESFVPLVRLFTMYEQNAFTSDELLRRISKNNTPHIISVTSTTYSMGTEHQVRHIVAKNQIHSFTYCERFQRFANRDETYDRPLGVGHQLQLFNTLFSWHFDIHGLIDAGLALPIND